MIASTSFPLDAYERAQDICTCYACHFVRDELVSQMVRKGIFASTCEKRKYDEIHMHHIEFSDVILHIMLRVSIKIVDKLNNYVYNIPFLVKIPRKEKLLDSYAIKSEITLYNMIEKNLDVKDSIVPKCYTACFWNVTLLPVVVLEDIMQNGYKQLEGRLNEAHLRICMRDLAKFHASTLKLFKKNTDFTVSEQINNLKYLPIDKSAISDFMRDWNIWNSINIQLTRKIKRILFMNIQNVRPEFLTTIIHGCLIKSKLWFRYTKGEPCDMKIIDWQGTKIGSPAVDFGRILLTNMPDTNNISKLGSFCRRMLGVYVNCLKKHHEYLSTDFLMEYIAKRLIFSYIDLYASHDQSARNPIKMLHIFDEIAIFD